MINHAFGYDNLSISNVLQNVMSVARFLDLSFENIHKSKD